MPEPDEHGLSMLLVADEDEDLRELARIVLESPTLHVFEARDAVTALRLAKEVVPHAMLLGGSIFGSETDAVLQRLADDPETAETRVVLVLDKSVQEAASGAAAHLVRPFGPEELVRTVEEVLSREPASEYRSGAAN